MARILLADDDPATRDFVRRSLATDGHDVVATQDGSEALERITQGGGFDLLISDVQMPSLDGISLVEQAIQAEPKLRVVLMSGFAEELDRAKGIPAKVLRVIIKPFTLDRIRAEVKAALEA